MFATTERIVKLPSHKLGVKRELSFSSYRKVLALVLRLFDSSFLHNRRAFYSRRVTTTGETRKGKGKIFAGARGEDRGGMSS